MGRGRKEEEEEEARRMRLELSLVQLLPAPAVSLFSLLLTTHYTLKLGRLSVFLN